MEFFTKGNGVKLRSHLDKYLVADDDQETVRQSRNGASRRAVWTVETVVDKPNLIRFRSCHGKYLTASDMPFLLGMTGEKATQTASSKPMDWQTQWEPIRDGFQVKLKSWCGKWLRANGGTPPWRNSVTHDEPHTLKTKNWILWDVLAVDGDPETLSLGDETLSSFSSFGSPVSPHLNGSDPGTPASVGSVKIFGTPRGTPKPKSSLSQTEGSVTAMEFFHGAKAVRLRSVHDKYLTADEDEETVTQDRNGSAKSARWTVELVRDHVIRLRSCYGLYLTASNERFLLGATGHKVVQSKPSRLDSSVEWEPIGDGGSRVKLRTSHGNYLRANGGVPPWRNSVTHDIPHRTATQEWILWNVDVVEILVDPKLTTAASPPPPTLPQRQPPQTPRSSSQSGSSSPSSVSPKSDHFYGREWSDHPMTNSPPKLEGRTIYYHMANDMGEVEDESSVGYPFTFKGNNVEQLTQELRQETGLDDVVVCTRSPLNGRLFPLRLQLPPNNASMRVVLVPSSSRLARDFAI